MDHAALMRGFHGVGDLDKQFNRLARSIHAAIDLLGPMFIEGKPVDVLHDEKERPIRGAGPAFRADISAWRIWPASCNSRLSSSANSGLVDSTSASGTDCPRPRRIRTSATIALARNCRWASGSDPRGNVRSSEEPIM